jgi:hypothetical protein
VTPAERRLYDALVRQAAGARPEVQAAMLALWEYARTSVTDAELTRAITAGQVERIVRQVVEAFTVARATAPVREAIRSAYRRSAEAGIRTLPLPRGTVVDIAFNWLNPRIVDAVTTLESTALGTLSTEAAETVRQVVRRGIEAGQGPRALIPQLRESIGLAPNQEAAIANFREALASGDFAKARGYALRDRRFDALLKRGEGLTPEQVDRMTAAYRSRMQAFNAETHARTAALDATRAGQRASWETAIEQGGVDRTRVRKRWVATLDTRTRDEHADANGLEVQLDELFPVDGGVALPGEGTYNCRCTVAYRVAPLRS